MIARGLSEETISRLRFLDACDAIPDTDIGVLVKAAVRASNESSKFKLAEILSKRIQLFINADMYREFYKDDLKPKTPSNIKPGPIKPGTRQFEELKRLIGGLSGGRTVNTLAE